MIKDRISKDELKAALRAHPEEFRMEYWGEQTACGTTFCIAGWAMTLAGGYTTQPDCTGADLDFYKNGKKLHSPAIEAARLLGIPVTPNEFVPIFYLSSWPKNLEDHYRCAVTPVERVEVACQVIDYFIP